MVKFKYVVLFFCLFVNRHGAAQKSDFATIDFTRADERAYLYGGKSLDNLPLLVYDLTSRLDTDVEKFRAIYKWVCGNIKSDIPQSDLVIRRRKKHKNDPSEFLEWNNQYKKTTFKRLLKDKKTMCTGYAYLIKTMCILANIEAEIINGYGRTAISNVKSLDMVNHSWNAVKLNDQWYLCDATWSSGYIVNNNSFVEVYNDGYFLADPKIYAKSHFPSDIRWSLLDITNNANFSAPPLIYGETFERQIIPIHPKKMDLEILINDKITFHFKTLVPIKDDTIQLVYYSGAREHQLEISTLLKDNDSMSFTHQFKHKGSYDVHLKIMEDIVATYTIQVAKTEIDAISLVNH